MSNYRENLINGSQWTRAAAVTIRNPLGQTPHIEFAEEGVISIPGESPITRGLGTIVYAAFDAENGTIPLVNPETGESLNTTISHAELYTILYSLYLQHATIRDNTPVLSVT